MLLKMNMILPCNIVIITCLGFFGPQDTYRISSVMCHVTQGGQGKKGRQFHGAMLPRVLLTNFSNGNMS
jgi:hypothetical protein